MHQISRQVGVPRSTVHLYVKGIEVNNYNARIDPVVMREMIQEGYTHDVVALRFKVTRQAVTMALSRERGKARRRRMTPAEVIRAVDLRGQGWSLKKIAQEIGFSEPAIHHRLKNSPQQERDDDRPKARS